MPHAHGVSGYFGGNTTFSQLSAGDVHCEWEDWTPEWVGVQQVQLATAKIFRLRHTAILVIDATITTVGEPVRVLSPVRAAFATQVAVLATRDDDAAVVLCTLEAYDDSVRIGGLDGQRPGTYRVRGQIVVPVKT